MNLKNDTWLVRWYFYLLSKYRQHEVSSIRENGSDLCDFIRTCFFWGPIRVFWLHILVASFFGILIYNAGIVQATIAVLIGVGFAAVAILLMATFIFSTEKIKAWWKSRKSSEVDAEPGPLCAYVKSIKEKTCLLIKFN